MALFDPNNPLGLPNRPSPLDPRTTRNPYDSVFQSPPLVPQVMPRSTGFIDPTNPLGIPSRQPADISGRGSNNPYGSIFDPSNAANAGQNIVAMIPRTERNTPPMGAPTTGANMPPGASPGTIDDYYNRVMNLIPSRRQQGLTDIGSVMGALGNNEMANRISRGNFTQAYDDMMLGREDSKNRLGLVGEEQRNRTEADALGKLRTTSFLKGGGFNDAPKFDVGGNIGTSLNLPRRMVSPEEQQGASTLQEQVLRRLQPAPGTESQTGTFQPSFDYQPHSLESYTTPGKMENIGRYGDLTGGVLGALGNIFGGGGGQQGGQGGGVVNTLMGAAGKYLGGGNDNQGGQGGGVGNALMGSAGKYIGNLFGGGGSATTMIPGTGIPTVAGAGGTGLVAPSGAGGVMSGMMGKALPIAGAAMGTYGLLKDRGTKSNVMNGMTAGAGYGSMVAPGIGTAIGAGVGALGGYLRGIGGPSETEVKGREVAMQGRQQISSGASQQQIQEAMGSGWSNPMDALPLIVVRDRLRLAGKDPNLANQLVDQLGKSEKGGPQAVQQALQNLMNSVGM